MIVDFDIEPDFLCPITQQIMEEPVSLSDGHTYEKKAIETWLQNHMSSPLTNQRLSSKDLHPNHFAKKMIRNALEKAGICTKDEYIDTLNGMWKKLETLRFPPQYLSMSREDGNTLLHQAALDNQVWVIDLINSTDFDINMKISLRNSEGNTPLHLASQKGNLEVVVKLIQLGSKINSKDNEGWTPLHRAAQKGHTEIVKEFIKVNADVNCGKKNGNTPIHSACWNGHVEIVKDLIRVGASVNVRSGIGDTPLHSATWQNRVEVIQELLNSNVDVNARKKNGDTALHLAARRDHIEVATELISFGSNVNATNDEGCTPLFVAVENSKSKLLISLLLRAGADPTHQNKQGKTALDLCTNDELAEWITEEQEKYAQMIRRLPSKVHHLEAMVKQQQDCIQKLESQVQEQQETIEELRKLVSEMLKK